MSSLLGSIPKVGASVSDEKTQSNPGGVAYFFHLVELEVLVSVDGSEFSHYLLAHEYHQNRKMGHRHASHRPLAWKYARHTTPVASTLCPLLVG